MSSAVDLIHVQHAPGKPGAQRQAVSGSTGHVAQSTQQHYSAEAITAMTALGLIGIGIAVTFLLVCGALLKRITGGKQHREAVGHGR